MSVAIRVQNLRKHYRNVQAVRDLSFEVEEGDIYGFLGPNGAGKTTTMRVLATLLRPDYGIAEVMGHDCVREAKTVRPIIGYMPDSSGAYRDMMVSEYLEFFAAAYRIPAVRRQSVVNDCIELTGIQDKRDELIEGLSRGMRQRLGLARCLVNDPKVLILDEPASGLDPRARIEVQEILRTLGNMGKTVLISSHILSELKMLCNKIGILENGSLVYSGTIKDALAKTRTKHRLEIRPVDRPDAAAEILRSLPQIEDAYTEDGTVIAELAPDTTDFSFVASELVSRGYRVLTIKEEEVLLEDAFLKLTGHAPPPLPGRARAE